MTAPSTASQNGRQLTGRRRIRTFSSAIRNNLRMVVGLPVFIVGMTFVLILWMRPLYEVGMSIRIDEDGSGIAILQALESLSSGDEVHTEMAVLRSRTLAEEVVDSLSLQVVLDAPKRVARAELLSGVVVTRDAREGIYTLAALDERTFSVEGELLEPRDVAQPFDRRKPQIEDFGTVRVGETAILSGVRFALTNAAAGVEEIVIEVLSFGDAVEEFQESIAVVQPDREADVVDVIYRSADELLVTLALNTLARRFIARRQDIKSAEARSTVAFLDEQVDTLETQLHSAEEELKDFREAYKVSSLEIETETQLRRLAELQARRDLFEAERDALAVVLAQAAASTLMETEIVPGAASPYRRLIGFPTLLQNPGSSEMLALLGELENRQAELLMRQTPQNRDVRVLNNRIRELEGQLQEISTTYRDGLSNQIESLNAILAASEDLLAQIPEKEMTFIRFKRRTDVLGEIFVLLQTRQKEAEIAANVEDFSVRVIDPAVAPREPVRPRPVLSLVLAVILGSAMGVGGAVAREHSDRTVRHREELQAITGFPVLGAIPPIPAKGGRRRFAWGRGAPSGPRLVSRLAAGNHAAEAYRALRTNLAFAGGDHVPKILVLTSPMPGDGKSSIACNLSFVLARGGVKVALVDADLRRGALADAHGVSRIPGLSEVLTGQAELADAMRSVDVDAEHRFALLPAGFAPPNPAELLGLDRMKSLLEGLAEKHDLVIVDAPPLNLVTDAAILGALGDGVILVVRAGVTEEGPLGFAVDQLEKVGARVLGTVLNEIGEAEDDRYGTAKAKAYQYYGQG
ncbi:MAG: polysaccharide biosynthesis tyrosine autokinase [Gemmatimonadetes bacterium]|nr:polysaccharide biosynthesis tyrosine autokinase [Gemmatimonadota bacterium]